MAVSSRKTPKMAINRDFPGLRAFSANVARDKIEEQEIPHPMVKSTARFGAPKVELWPFQSPGGATAVSSRKTPKMERNCDFPGLRAFSANGARDKIEEQEIPHPMVKSTARFGAPKVELWPFQSPGGATAVSSRKTPKMERNRDFPGLRAFSANGARDKIEEQEVPHPMVKSTARFGALKIEIWPF